MQSRTHVVLLLGVVLLFAGMALSQAQNDIQITKGPVVEHTDANSAVIAWSTNVPSSTVVKYGTDQNNLTQTAQLPWGGLTHRVTIKSLDPGKTYFYQVQSGQAEGTGMGALGPVGTFSTKAANSATETNPANSATPASAENQFRITNGPAMEQVGDTSATVAWSTDRPSSSVVKYGTDPNNLDQTAQEPWGATTHRVQLKNLKPSTPYYVSIHSAQGKDSPGQQAEVGPIQFTTVASGQQASKQ
jgi:phosphodiesterase/alkaline phosphatase D-like protein